MAPSVKPSRLGRENSEILGVRALGFLAQDPERLERFLALSGLEPGTLRQAANDPRFLVAVLDHILSDETLLIDFAADMSIHPSQVASARHSLAPEADL